MRKIYFLLSVFAFSISISAQTTELTETFDFTGALDQNGWTKHSPATGADQQLQASGGTANLVAGNSQDVNKALTTAYALQNGYHSKVSYTVTANVLNSTGLSTSGDYFISLGGTTGTSVSSLPGRIYAKGTATGVLFGTLNNSGTGSTPNYVTTEVPYNTPTALTLTYEVIKDAAGTVVLQKSSLQVGSETITNTTGITAPPANIASIAIRQSGSATSGTGNISLDNITVTSYAAVLGVSDITSIKSNFVKNTLVNDEINFSAGSNVKIYNMNGQVVKAAASVSENKNLEVSELAPGMYIVTGTVNGEPVSQKILKK